MLLQDYVIILIGTNDINGGINKEDILKNHKKILDTITEKLPQTEIYLISIIPQNHDVEEYAEIDVNETTLIIMDINQKLKEIGNNYPNVTYVDLFSELEDDQHFLKKEYSDDGIHLNRNGFEVWAKVLKPHI